MLKHGEGEDLKDAILYIPDSGSILKSVTTKSIADIAAKTFGWNVEVAPILFSDVKVGFYVSAFPGRVLTGCPGTQIRRGSSSRNSGCHHACQQYQLSE